MMRIFILILTVLVTGANAVAAFAQSETTPTRHLLVITGAEGNESYGTMFRQWEKNWITVGQEAGFETTRIDGSDPANSSLDLLKNRLASVSDDAPDSPRELWLVLIGHGTFDGDQARFNLVGPDVTAKQLATWLETRSTTTVVINCASASAPFTNELTGPGRIVVSSTRSGYEMNFCRFGQYLSEAVANANVDLDKDQQTSLLEAVISASSMTAEFYSADARLATEHALIEDNGDGRGTPVEWFRGIRVNRVAKDGTPADGLKANQIFFRQSNPASQLSPRLRKKRDEMEEQLERLRGQKQQLTEEQYYRQLDSLMTRLALLYEPESDEASSSTGDSAENEPADGESGSRSRPRSK